MLGSTSCRTHANVAYTLVLGELMSILMTDGQRPIHVLGVQDLNENRLQHA